MNVFVIGASGFTGRRVLAACPADWSVVGLARSTAAAQAIEALGATSVRGDLADPEGVCSAITRLAPDAVLCVASLGFGHGPRLVEAIGRAGVTRAVFTSTTGIFTALEPASKQVRVAAEQAIETSELDATIVRPTMIYGRPGDRNMERLLGWLRRVPAVVAPDRGRALQQPVHVDDLAAALVAAVQRPEAIGHAINVPGPDALPFAAVVDQAAAAVGRRGRVVPAPFELLRSAVAFQEQHLRRPRLKAEQIDRLAEHKAFDVEPARKLLGHDPRPFAQGIAAEAVLLGMAR